MVLLTVIDLTIGGRAAAITVASTAGTPTPPIQSSLYISLPSGPEDPMPLERLCVYRGFL